MKQIADRGGDPFVFSLSSDDSGLWINTFDAKPLDGWSASRGFVFRTRKDA
ncbi:MAG: hypothetical protein UY07_C0007G0058 [Parcubacteria group bacterium GW2011_GWA1_47_8]|nr:MAG: hypothetical protein UY07_C0007G0058 [Parcubacteria group bacterium GW2011_GWA1_47_8]KKW07628.1 MAG: hypothetical protein UY42_C0009G0001 [Parcubacteria group bacterium GW2011_GWA2_49_16]